MRHLQGRREVDRARIGLLGHSEGGLIAAMVAARNADVAFVSAWPARPCGGTTYETLEMPELRAELRQEKAVAFLSRTHRRSPFSRQGSRAQADLRIAWGAPARVASASYLTRSSRTRGSSRWRDLVPGGWGTPSITIKGTALQRKHRYPQTARQARERQALSKPCKRSWRSLIWRRALTSFSGCYQRDTWTGRCGTRFWASQPARDQSVTDWSQVCTMR